MKNFKSMLLPPELEQAVEKMKIVKPTLIQSKAIPIGIEGRDIIAVAETGSGKTLAFALSLLTNLLKRPSARALVLSPSREMAQQTYKVFLSLCAELPISNCLLIGGVPTAKQANQLRKNPRVIIATPGRMNDHLQSNKMLLQNVEIVVLDEADRMLDMGFAPQVKAIQNTLRSLKQTMLFSASFSKAVQSMAKLFQKPNAVTIRTEKSEEPVGTLKQKIVFLEPAQKDDRLLDELNATKVAAIVFTGSQESCERVGLYLQDYGFAAEVIHGGHSQGHRNRVMRAFHSSEIRIVVATDLLARGLDVPQVELVLNYELPFQPEDFLHRIGRTARAGRGGRAITFITKKDLRMYERIKPYLTGATEE